MGMCPDRIAPKHPATPDIFLKPSRDGAFNDPEDEEGAGHPVQEHQDVRPGRQAGSQSMGWPRASSKALRSPSTVGSE